MLSKSFLITLCFTVFSSCLFAQDQSSLLWKIEGNELTKPSYLYGTIHVNDKRAFQISDSTYHFINNCDIFALEVHPDSVVKAAFYEDFHKSKNDIKQFLNDDEYKKLKKKFKELNGYNLDGLESKSPLAIQSLMRPKKTSPEDRETFVDAYLFGIARSLDKVIIGLEDEKSQIESFNNGSEEDQRNLVLSLINQDTSEYFQHLNTLIESYESGNLDSIKSMVGSFFYNDSIMVQRNLVMFNSIAENFTDQSVFAAIGAAHLLGEKGLIQLFRDKGYQVSPVLSKNILDPDIYKLDYEKHKWHNYSDSSLGYSVETPGPVYDLSKYGQTGIKIYPDLVSGVVFIHYALDFRNAKEQNSEKKIVQNIVKNGNFKLLRKNKINKDGISATELVMEKNKLIFKYQIILRNNILYGAGASNKTGNFEEKIYQRFFNSFQCFQLPNETSNDWINFNQPNAAFSVSLPFKPKHTVNQAPYDPEDPSATIPVHLYMSLDLSNNANYLIAYNDFPTGYYLQSKQVALNNTISELTESNKVISKVDTIWLDGEEGREVTLMLQDQYCTKMQVFTRGNRVYKVMKQNLIIGQKSLPEDDFFKTFSFTPYKSTALNNTSNDSLNFSIGEFGPTKHEYSNETDNGSYVNEIDVFYTTNPNSGGVFSLSVCKLSQYLKIHSVDSFYTNYINDISLWSDTIVRMDTFNLNGLTGREVLLENTYNGSTSRTRLILNGEYLYNYACYVGKDELFSTSSNNYFNSFSTTKVENPPFNVFVDKAKFILKDIQSNDSIIKRNASNALLFYYFDSTHIPLLKTALKENYSDDSLSSGTKSNIIMTLGNLEAFNSEELEELYKNNSAENIKEKILIELLNLKDKEGIETFIPLFLSNPPENTYQKWRMTSVFEDSIELATKYFPDLITLLDNSNYSSSTISMFGSLSYSSDSSIIDLITNNANIILRDMDHVIDSFIIKKQTSDYVYSYSSEINNYLSILQNIDIDLEKVDKTTNRLMAIEKLGYLENKVIQVRLVKKLPISKKILKSKLKDESSRLNIIKSYQVANRLDEVAEAYKTHEEIARLSLINHLAYDYGAPSLVEKIGQFTQNDSIIYVFKFSFENNKKEYIGIAGPFENNSAFPELDNIVAYSDWVIHDNEWLSNAKKMVSSLGTY